MKKNKKNIVWILANNSSAPYFSSFAKREKQSDNFNLSFICLYHEEPKMVEEMELLGYKCYWVKYDHKKRKTNMIVSLLKIFFLLKKIKPDVIHSHLFDDSLISMIAGKLLGVKKRIVTKGDTGFHFYYQPQWVLFDKLINYLATDIVAISNESMNFILNKEKCNPNKIRTIHHGLDIPKVTAKKNEKISFFKKQYQLDGKIVIGTISRFIEWKKYKDIVEAVKIATKENSNLIFLFIGQGAQKAEIEKLVISENLSSTILFTNWIDPNDIPSIFGIMNIFLHAAKNEPFGLVIAEAMLNGVPVVSTNTGAASDSIEHQKSGYLCPPENPIELAKGIKFILKHNHNNQIGILGKKQAEKMFSLELMHKKHLELYR